MIDADDDAPIYKLNNPASQVMRDETRKMHLARSKSELDLAGQRYYSFRFDGLRQAWIEKNI